MVLFSHFDFSKLNQQDRNPVNTFALYAYSIDEIRKTSVAYTRTFACINTILKQLVGRLDSLEAYEDMLVQPYEDLMRNPSFILLGKTNSIYVQKLILLTRELFSDEFLTGEDGQFILCQELIMRKDELLTETLPNYYTVILRKVSPAAQHFFHFYGIIYPMKDSPLKNIVNQYFFDAAKTRWNFIKDQNIELLAHLYIDSRNAIEGDFDTLYKLTTDRVFYNNEEQVNMLDIVNDFLSQLSLMRIDQSQHERVLLVTDERFPDKEFPEVFDSLTRSTREEIIVDTQLYTHIYEEVRKKKLELDLDTEINITLLEIIVVFLGRFNERIEGMRATAAELDARIKEELANNNPNAAGWARLLLKYTGELNDVDSPVSKEKDSLELEKLFTELRRLIDGNLPLPAAALPAAPAPGNALRFKKEALMRRIANRIREINKKNPTDSVELLEKLQRYEGLVNRPEATFENLQTINTYLTEMKRDLAETPASPALAALPSPPDGIAESDRRILAEFKDRVTSLNLYYDNHRDSITLAHTIQAALARILEEIRDDPVEALRNLAENKIYVNRLELTAPGITYDESTKTHSGGRRTRKKRSYKKRSYKKRTYKRRR